MTSPQPPAHRPRKDGRWPLQRPTLPPGVSDGRKWVTVNRPSQGMASSKGEQGLYCKRCTTLYKHPWKLLPTAARGKPQRPTGRDCAAVDPPWQPRPGEASELITHSPASSRQPTPRSSFPVSFDDSRTPATNGSWLWCARPCSSFLAGTKEPTKREAAAASSSMMSYAQPEVLGAAGCCGLVSVRQNVVLMTSSLVSRLAASYVIEAPRPQARVLPVTTEASLLCDERPPTSAISVEIESADDNEGPGKFCAIFLPSQHSSAHAPCRHQAPMLHAHEETCESHDDI